MRDSYKKDLNHLNSDLERMLRYVLRATQRARSALQETDLALAEQTIDADDRIDDMSDLLESTALSMLALQAPVASDLRLVTGAMKVSQALERMGDLATHVAQLARNSYPEPPTPEPVQSVLNDMADQVVRSVSLLGKLLEEHDMDLVSAIIDGDDDIDEYNHQVRKMVRDPQIEMTRQQIVNATLLARFLERLGDHTAKAAGRMLYIVRGDLLGHNGEITN